MELAAELERALATVCTAGPAEVRENGEWLAALGGLQYKVRSQGDTALLHLWGARQSWVRRVVRVAEQSPGRVVLDVSRFGRARHAKLEFLVGGIGAGIERVFAHARVKQKTVLEDDPHLLAQRLETGVSEIGPVDQDSASLGS